MNFFTEGQLKLHTHVIVSMSFYFLPKMEAFADISRNVHGKIGSVVLLFLNIIKTF